VDAAELSFPLVPRWRPVGSAFGRLRAARRGIGSSVAGTRPYRAGDDPSVIDWKLSARLSSMRGETEFVVREDFADEAPRVVVVVDCRPSMALYPDDLPWLSKPQALRSVWKAVARASVRELGLAGYLDTAAGEGWFPPRSAAAFDVVDERQESATFDAPADGLEHAFERLAQSRRSLPPGGQTQVEQIGDDRVLSVGMGSQTSVDVMLSRPLSVDVKKTRGEPVTQIRFHADDPEALVAAAQAQLDARRAAPEPRGGASSPA